ncbi:MAG TPA: hypothetical protein VHN77_13370 [Phycisphaerales bacterium]|nr:hypothetical protein [Phycisphaerales bacterium]
MRITPASRLAVAFGGRRNAWRFVTIVATANLLFVVLYFLVGSAVAQTCCETTAQNTADALYYLEAQNANIQAMTDGMGSLIVSNQEVTARLDQYGPYLVKSQKFVGYCVFLGSACWGFGPFMNCLRSSKGLLTNRDDGGAM